MLVDELEVLWAKPTTGRWYGRSEVLSHLHVALREGYAVQARSR